MFPSGANDKGAKPSQSVGQIKATDLSDGTIVAMRLQKSHYLTAESIVIEQSLCAGPTGPGARNKGEGSNVTPRPSIDVLLWDSKLASYVDVAQRDWSDSANRRVWNIEGHTGQ